MNNLNFNKYKNIEVVTHPTLFEPDFRVLKDGICPFCYKKLRTMRFKPLMFCPSKQHKFIKKLY